MSLSFFSTSVSAQMYQTIDVPTREILLEENKTLAQQISLLQRQVYRLEMALEDSDFFTIDRSKGVPVSAKISDVESAQAFQELIEPGEPVVNQSFQNYTNKYLAFDHPTDWEVMSLGKLTMVGPIDTDQFAEPEDAPVVLIYTMEMSEEFEDKDLEEELLEFQEGYIEGFYKGDGKKFTNVEILSDQKVTINGKTFQRVVVTAEDDGEPHKQYMIFGASAERLYGISFPAKLTTFNANWTTIERLYQSIVFNDKVNVNRVGQATSFKNENFEFEYTNDWEMNNLDDVVVIMSPFQDKDDGFQETVILLHQKLTEEMEGLTTDEVLKKMETADKASVDSMEVMDEALESIAGLSFKKQLVFAKKGELEFVVIRYAYADGEDAYFVTYTALPDQVEVMGDQFKQIIESLELTGKKEVQGIYLDETLVPFA